MPHGYRISQVFSCISNGIQCGLSCGLSMWAFLFATLSYMPDLWSGWDIVVTCTLWPVLAIKAHRYFKVAIGLTVASDQSPTWSVIQFGGTSWSRQGLGGAIHLPLLNNCLHYPVSGTAEFILESCQSLQLRPINVCVWFEGELVTPELI
jgi:hypothetical protein